LHTDDHNGAADRPVEQTPSDKSDVNRRKALRRLGVYMAPAMLAMLVSEANAACVSKCD